MNFEACGPPYPVCANMEWLGRFKRVKPTGKKALRINTNPENELVELVKKGKNTTYSKCDLDSVSMKRCLQVFIAFMSAGKVQSAAEICRSMAEKCFDKTPENPYRLMFLSFAMIADCEARFYDLNIFQLSAQDMSLKLRYSLCYQATNGILEMEPTIFNMPQLLTVTEELAHFSCFRQCHVILLKKFAEIGEDDNFDWFDIVKVLDSNILALLNDSDIAFRLCESEKEKKEFHQNLHKLSLQTIESSDQYCYSWFNHLHFREICVRANAATEVIKSDLAYKNFIINLQIKKSTEKSMMSGAVSRRLRRRLRPLDPMQDVEDAAKRISLDDSGVLADSNIVLRKNSKTLIRRKPNQTNKIYFTDTDSMNYTASLFNDSKVSYSDLNADTVKKKTTDRKEREKSYNAGGHEDCRKRMPDHVRRRIRMLLRKMTAEAREMQIRHLIDDKILNLAFPVTDDECSDEETAPRPFLRTETVDIITRKKSREFGKLRSKSGVKKVLWWHNAKDELLTARSIANHCLKVGGDSSGPYGKFEEYLGKYENGATLRDRRYESNRVPKCRAFDLKTEIDSDDGMLLTMPSTDIFNAGKTNNKVSPDTIGLNSLLLQNMRRRSIDELLVMMMIVKGQQQLQDGNVIRCLAYMMLIDYKLAVFRESSVTPPAKDNNFYPYLVHLHIHLLSKFRLYGMEIFGKSGVTKQEKAYLQNEGDVDLVSNCVQFCRNTQAYFFCICIRGRVVPNQVDESGVNTRVVQRSEVEAQHEFFFGLDNTSKNGHLYSFWRTECMPIVSGVIHMIDQSLVDKIDEMDYEEASKILEKAPGLSHQTRAWMREITKCGFMKQKPEEKPKIEPGQKQYVPVLFQLPSRTFPEHNTPDMVNQEDLDRLHKATTDFTREKYIEWKEICKADKENIKKTNRDQKFDVEEGLMFFGEAIEKDVYMVSVYKGELSSDENENISSKMHLLCRKIRSQAGFISVNNFHAVEDVE